MPADTSYLDAMRGLLGTSTRSIGPLFTTAACVANALRLVGSADATHPSIGDCLCEGQAPVEFGCDFQLCAATLMDLAGSLPFNESLIECRRYSAASDSELFDYRKADEAVSWIIGELNADRIVVTDSWFADFEASVPPLIFRRPLLILAWESERRVFHVHDPIEDDIETIPLTSRRLLLYGGRIWAADSGLRGRISHDGYACVSFGLRDPASTCDAPMLADTATSRLKSAPPRRS